MSDCSTNALKAKKPRNCRHCTNMVCGDANYCEYTGETYSDGYIRARRNCPGFEYNPIDALTLDGIDDVFRAERERALYEKRMRGDWS